MMIVRNPNDWSGLFTVAQMKNRIFVFRDIFWIESDSFSGSIQPFVSNPIGRPKLHLGSFFFCGSSFPPDFKHFQTSCINPDNRSSSDPIGLLHPCPRDKPNHSSRTTPPKHIPNHATTIIHRTQFDNLTPNNTNKTITIMIVTNTYPTTSRICTHRHTPSHLALSIKKF
jgi:hypothetical protein